MATTTRKATGLLGRPSGRSSAGTLNARRIYSPWEHAGQAYPDWVIRRRDLQGPRELLCWRRRVIILDIDQGTAATRCSLAHALAHLELKHAAGQTVTRFQDRDERAADILAARWLIDLDLLIDAVLPAGNPFYRPAVASTLWVDLDMLNVRLDDLHPAERGAISAAIAARDNEEGV